jgi:hypothetical protein
MRNEIITKINDLFDENTNLRARNAFLEAKENENNKVCISDSETKNSLDKRIIEIGKKTIADTALKKYGNDVYTSRDEETKEIKQTTFEHWLENKLYAKDIPKNMTYEEVKEVIYPYAKELYEKEKAESLKKFEEREKEESDE